MDDVDPKPLDAVRLTCRLECTKERTFRAVGVHADVCVEATNLHDLRRKLKEAVRRLYGADVPTSMVIGNAKLN